MNTQVGATLSWASPVAQEILNVPVGDSFDTGERDARNLTTYVGAH